MLVPRARAQAPAGAEACPKDGAAAAAAVGVSTGAVVREVRVKNLNVFDLSVPGEDRGLYRLANRIHVVTREHVARRELLLGPGDPYDPLGAAESERLMRGNGSFRKAEVRPVPRPDGDLDLEVTTQDAWTLNPVFGVGTEGGDHFFMLGAFEANLLGYGKSIGYLHSQFGPRIRNDFRYHDPRFLGTRARLSGLFATTIRGKSFGIDLARPFFSLDTPWAAGSRWFRTIQEDILYLEGTEHTRFTSSARAGHLSAARRVPLGPGVHRAEAGWFYDRTEFFPTADTKAGTLPENRKITGPLAGYTWMRPNFVKETYINKMERCEDINLGNEFRVMGGPMTKSFGSDRDRFVYSVTDQQGLRLGSGRFLLAHLGASGRTLNSRSDNQLLFGGANLYWQSHAPTLQTSAAHVEASLGRALDRENQLSLGGHTGLRGYKNFSFNGSKAILVNLEHRIFFPGFDLLRLFRVGAAVFFDSGAAAPEGSGISWKRFKSDIGAGLRMGSMRSRGGHVVRFDAAYALDPGPGPRWVFSVKGGQAFDIGASASRLVRRSPGSNLNEGSPAPSHHAR